MGRRTDGAGIGGCGHCGGTGYEDYPTNRLRCRIPGHSEAMDAFVGAPRGGNLNRIEEDICENRHGGSETSVEAFESTPASTRERQRWQIVRYVKAQGKVGATAQEAAVALDIPLQTTSARCSELKRDGTLVDSGLRRLTPQRKKAVVLIWREPAVEGEQELLFPGGGVMRRDFSREWD